MKRMTPFSSFVLVFLGGLLLTTIVFRVAQRQDMDKQRDSVTVPQPTEAHKLYLDAKIAASELLFNVAFASVAGLLGLHFSDSARSRVSGHTAFAACGLLLASLYGAFLFQAGVSHCLEVSPEDMYGPVLNYPIICQFWLLFGAIVLLAMTLLRRPGPAASALLAAVILCAAPHADAEETIDCVRQWAATRHVTLTPAATADAVMLLRKLDPPEVTDSAVVYSLLDEIRFTAIDNEMTAERPESEAIAAWLHEAVTLSDTPRLSVGELISRLTSIAEVWRVPAAVLELTNAGSVSLFVTIVTQGRRPVKQWRKRTPCVVRLPAGKYEVTAGENARVVFNDVVELKDGDRRKITMEPPR